MPEAKPEIHGLGFRLRGLGFTALKARSTDVPEATPNETIAPNMEIMSM